MAEFIANNWISMLVIVFLLGVIIGTFIFLYIEIKRNSVRWWELLLAFSFSVILMFVFAYCDLGTAASIVITLGFNYIYVESRYNTKYADKRDLIDTKVKEYNKGKPKERELSFNEKFFDRHNSMLKILVIWFGILPIIISTLIIPVDNENEKINNLIDFLNLCEKNFQTFGLNRLLLWGVLEIFFLIFISFDPFKMTKIPQEIHSRRKKKYDIFKLIDIEACDCIEENNEKDFILKFKNEENNLDEFKKCLKDIFSQEKNVHDFYNEISKDKYKQFFEHYLKNCTEEEFRHICEVYYTFGESSVYIDDYDDEEIKIMEKYLKKVSKKS